MKIGFFAVKYNKRLSFRLLLTVVSQLVPQKCTSTRIYSKRTPVLFSGLYKKIPFQVFKKQKNKSCLDIYTESNNKQCAKIRNEPSMKGERNNLDSS